MACRSVRAQRCRAAFCPGDDIQHEFPQKLPVEPDETRQENEGSPLQRICGGYGVEHAGIVDHSGSRLQPARTPPRSQACVDGTLGRIYTWGMDEGYSKIVSFVARGTKSGKTTVMERVIEALKRRGLKVCAVKHGMHMHHRDAEGKDTDRFARSGADRVALFSPEGLVVYEKSPPDMAYLVMLATTGVDVVLIEGYKSGPFRKIEVFNPGLYDRPLYVDNPSAGYVAVVSDTRMPGTIRSFLFGETEEICTFIQEITAPKMP